MKDLISLLHPHCKIFTIEYEKDKYRLVLDGAKDFIGDTLKEVVLDAMDWIDCDKANSETENIKQSAIYKLAGYESDGRE